MRRWKELVLTLSCLLVTTAWADLPDDKTLCDHLSEIPGWNAASCEGIKMNSPMMGEVVTASRTYRRGEAVMQASVVSGMQAAMMWAPYAAGMQMESDEALVKIEKVDGFPVGISYDKRSESGGIVVQLDSEAVLVVNFEHMGWKEAFEAVKKLEWKGLRRLFE